MPSTTEITVATGDRYRVTGSPAEIERLILNAARGSIMELAWMVEAETGGDPAMGDWFAGDQRRIRGLGARDVEIEPGEHVLSSPLRRAVTPANPNRAR